MRPSGDKWLTVPAIGGDHELKHPVYGPSVFSLEIFECTYDNKDRRKFLDWL